MWRTILACVLLVAAAAANAQQVEYVKRSDLWAYSMGKEAGKLGSQAVGFNDYVRGLEQQRRKLEDLKQRLAQCGGCADRSRLAAEAKQLQDKLDNEERILCGGFMAAQEDFNPAVGAMNKLFGVSSMCARLNEERTKAMADGIYKLEKERFAARLKAGDVTAYNGLGMITMTTFGHLPNEERLSLACPYWFEGARRGDPTSTGQLTDMCIGSATESERKEAFDLVKGCADKGAPYCLSNLGWYYASTRNPSAPSPVPANDQEALRLWDQAATKGWHTAKRDAHALRVKLGLATATLPEPAQRLPGEPAPWVLKEGRYTAKGKDTQGRPYEGFCTVLAQGNDRYQFSWQIGSESRAATASVRGSLVEVDSGSGVTRYTILNTSGLVLLTSPNETLTLKLNAPSAAATGEVVDLPPVASKPPVRVTERFDPNAFRCAQMAKSVEQFRARAEKRPDQWGRPYAKAQQDYALQCPTQ